MSREGIAGAAQRDVQVLRNCVQGFGASVVVLVYVTTSAHSNCGRAKDVELGSRNSCRRAAATYPFTVTAKQCRKTVLDILECYEKGNMALFDAIWSVQTPF